MLYFLGTGFAAVICEALKSYTNAGKEEDFYFLRDGNGNEIDLLMFQDNTLFPIEIKQHTEPSSKDIRHFDMLNNLKTITVGEGGINILGIKQSSGRMSVSVISSHS